VRILKGFVVNKSKLGEPRAHAMMRNAKFILLALLVAALIATILLIFLYRSAAYLVGLQIPFLFLAFIILSYYESRVAAKMLRSRNQTTISSEEIEVDVQFAGIYTPIVLVSLLAISALVMAATMVENWAMVGASAALILMLSIFYVLPYVPFFIADAEQDERDKVQPEAEKPEQLHNQ
jgi:cytochrome c biogenesis protein CcdA